jgi:hypothetical protein
MRISEKSRIIPETLILSSRRPGSKPYSFLAAIPN